MGFDWNDTRAVILKIREELDEVQQAINETPNTIQEELGDLLFCVVNLARHFCFVIGSKHRNLTDVVQVFIEGQTFAGRNLVRNF